MASLDWGIMEENEWDRHDGLEAFHRFGEWKGRMKNEKE